MKDTRFTKVVVFINALVPLALLGWDVYHRRVGANPVEFVTRTTGILTLIFLLVSLAVTPVRKITGFNWLGKFRRMLGLYAFFYGFLHFITYVWFDKAFDLAAVPADVARRPFVAVGMLAFFLMVPLAVTSTDRMIKRLGGKSWARLHKAAYVAAIGGVLHYYLLVKADATKPLLFALALAVLLGYRFVASYQKKKAPVSIKAPSS